MSSRFHDAVEREGSEEAARAPQTPAGEEPPAPSPDVTPVFEDDDEGGKANWDESDAAYMRLKELNPDDFE